MKKFYCDRCSRDMGSWPTHEITLPREPDMDTGKDRVTNGDPDQKFDICFECMDKIREFVLVVAED